MSGTQFVPRGSMYASYSSWIVTLTVDVAPYRNHLTAIKSKFSQLKANIHALLNADRRNSSRGESPVIGIIRRYDVGGIQIEINHFEAEIGHLQHMLEVLNTLATRRDARKKRSLLPFVGDVLSTLFGSATQKDLDKLRDGLIALDNSQSQLAHVLAHSMTVINKTNSEVQRNRAVINQLSQGLSRLDSRVTALIGDLKTNVHPFISYQQISQRVRGTLRVMARSLRMGYQALTAINNNIQHVMQGSLPISLLPPSELIPLLQAKSWAVPLRVANTSVRVRSSSLLTATRPPAISFSQFRRPLYPSPLNGLIWAANVCTRTSMDNPRKCWVMTSNACSAMMDTPIYRWKVIAEGGTLNEIKYRGRDS